MEKADGDGTVNGLNQVRICKSSSMMVTAL